MCRSEEQETDYSTYVVDIVHKVGVTPTTEERLALEKKERVLAELDKGREHLYEPVDRYRPGGYCPVIRPTSHPEHEYIQGRYLVVDKVDFSPFSTTWLCYDRREEKWRCLEINVSSESSGTSPEQLIRNTLLERGVDRATARKHGIVLPYETFWIESINGRHLVSVLPFLGPTLAQLQDMNQLDGDRRQAICQSLARSLDYLHSQGLCHGNLHPGNVRVWLQEGAFDDYAPDEIGRVIGLQPQRRLTFQGAWVPAQAHAPAFMYEVFDWYHANTPADMHEKLTTEVAIVDRGGAYLVADDGPPAGLRIPTHYQAPECIMRYAGSGTKTDVWALAATIIYVVTQADMLDAVEDDFEVLKMIEHLIGPMPEAYWQNAAGVFLEYCTQRWEKEGQAKGRPRPEIPRAEDRRRHSLSHMAQSGDELERRIKADGSYEDAVGDRLRAPQALRGGEGWDGPFCGAWYLDPEEVACLGDLLRQMLRWDPDERWDPHAVLGHAWFAQADRYTPRPKPNDRFIPPSAQPDWANRYKPRAQRLREEEEMEKEKEKEKEEEEKEKVKEKEEEKARLQKSEEESTPTPESETPGFKPTSAQIVDFAVLLLALFCMGWFGMVHLLANRNSDSDGLPAEPAQMKPPEFDLLLRVGPE